MTTQMIRNLTTLVAMRATEVERLQVEMAAKENVRERYQRSVDTLTGLYQASGASGNLPLALAGNCGDYKQAVMQLADSHRLDLHMHEADMAVSQRALNAAYARREVLGNVLDRKQQAELQTRRQQERKQHDELATQLWFRSKNQAL